MKQARRTDVRIIGIAQPEEDQETVRRTVCPKSLAARKRKARRKAIGTRIRILTGLGPILRWSRDTVHSQFACGRHFPVLNRVGDVPPECLAAVPATSLSGRRVVRELTARTKRRGRPGMIVSDKGPSRPQTRF